MNKKYSYEEALKRRLDNIDVPDEEDAWQKMNALLDENDKRKPFVLFKNYKVAVLVIISLLIVAALLIYTVEQTNESSLSVFKTNNFIKEKPSTDKNKKTPQSAVTSDKSNTAVNPSMVDKNKWTPLNTKADKTKKLTETKDQKTVLAKEQNIVAKTKEKINTKHEGAIHKATTTTQHKIFISKASVNLKTNSTSQLLLDSLKNGIKGLFKDTTATVRAAVVDSLIVKQKTTTSSKADTTSIASANKKTIVKTGEKLSVSAGFGVQQQIPVSGQKTISYGYNGTRNTLSDYIPSVFVRLEKDGKWFLQAEYIYSTPQLIRAFSYSRQTSADYSASTVTTTNFHLRKTFYSQAPVSFNYYIKRNWSAGVGVIYNSFRGAISEKEVTTKNVLMQTQSVVKQIVPIKNYTDSFLYKSHLYLLLQTDYNWRRLSLGLRYSKDVQPYIKYTMPDGTITEEKNWALEFILRFKLFKSRNF